MLKELMDELEKEAQARIGTDPAIQRMFEDFSRVATEPICNK